MRAMGPEVPTPGDRGAASLAALVADLDGGPGSAPTRLWWNCFSVALAALLVGIVAVAYLLRTGVGVWGVNNGVAWGYGITNFVFWIGVGHAGTLISAILLLLRQDWRIGVSRVAETMTVIAILCAVVFPVIHLGRPWLFVWLLPLPNSLGPLWVNFASALTWDVFAILTYFVTSVLFWYLGLQPDLAVLGERDAGLRGRVFGRLALGWTGSQRDWARHQSACRLLAGLATALVISVHSVVSFDFATSVVPGWHTTLFPPYFVVGAIFSGMAMVLVLVIPLQAFTRAGAYMTRDMLEALCKLMLATGSLLGLCYLVEGLMPLYSGFEPERFVMAARATGPMAPLFWTTVACNVLLPQLLWLRAVRRRPGTVFVIALAALAGMWLERFVIVVGAQERAFLPSSWADYLPTGVEVATLVGSLGLFFTGFLLFCRLLPVVPICETAAQRLPLGYAR